MTRDDIVRMAQEVAGVTYPDGTTGVKIGMSAEHLERFAKLVAAAERGECIAACRMYQDDDEPYPGFQNGVSCCIAAIENHEEFLEHMRKKGAP
jgi:hypothetical protein